MPRSLLAGVGALLVGGGLGVLAGFAPERADEGSPRSAAALGRSETVLVVVVRGAGELERLRAAVPEGRVLASGPEAFALAGGRVFATRVEAAGAPLAALGWAERRIEILDAGLLRSRAAAAGPAPHDPALALAKKDTLTASEAMQLVNQLAREP